jgi:hypothetical protein
LNGNATKLMALSPLTYKLDMGIGFNWFDYLGMGGTYARWDRYPLTDKVYPELDDASGWAAVRLALDELKPRFIRFGLPPNPHVDANGTFMSDTVHMKRLVWLNNWAEDNGCTIWLDTFTMPHYYEFPLNERTGLCLNMAAEDNEAYARRFVVPLLKYIVNEAKLQAVKWFNPINEPMEYGVYEAPVDGPNLMAHYVDMYRNMRSALDEAGISRERIGLVGIDNVDYDYFKRALDLLEAGVDLDPYVDAYSIHYYTLRFDYLQKGTPNSLIMDQLTAQLADYAHKRNKPLYSGEIGTFHYGKHDGDPAGAASCDACLTVAEGVIRGMNQGVGAFAFWCLMNPNTVDGWWSIFQVKEGHLLRSMYPYHIYGLLTRYAEPGATIYPLQPSVVNPLSDIHESGHVFGTLLEDQQGRLTILLVNNHPTDRFQTWIELPGHMADRSWDVITTDRVRLSEALPPIAQQETFLSFVLNPFSLTVLRASDE